MMEMKTQFINECYKGVTNNIAVFIENIHTNLLSLSAHTLLCYSAFYIVSGQ